MPNVNIGAAANDGTGDPLRRAFTILNANDQKHDQRLDDLRNALRDGAILALTNVAGTANAITADLAPVTIAAGITELSTNTTVELQPVLTNSAANPTIKVGTMTYGVRATDGKWPAGAFVPGRAYLLRRRSGNTLHVVAGDVTRVELAAEVSARALADTDLRNQIAAFEAGMHIVGDWNPATGAFPTTPAPIGAGDQWNVTGSGTIDGVSFAPGDIITAIKASPRSTTYAGNWSKRNGTATAADQITIQGTAATVQDFIQATNLSDRSQAMATYIQPDIQYLTVGGLRYARDPAGTALTTADGATWAQIDRKNNFTASSAPLPTNDASQGYAAGSRWLWQGQEWVAVGVTSGAARWAPTARITPQMFGATGGGVINDSPAVQAWLTFVILNNIEGYVPAGDYRLDTAVSVAFSGKRFSIIGCGIGASRFIVTSAGGGLLMDATDRASQFTGKDFSVVARGVSRGTGLRFSLVPGGNQHQRSVILDNVETKGEGIAADCFDKFIDLTGNWRPLVRGCVVGGPFGPGVSDNLTAASPMFVATAGLVIDHCYDPSVENCHVWSVRVGISARGTDQEALRLTNTVINGVRIGLDFYRTTREPIVWIDNCHVNFRDDGFRIDGARLVIIRGSHPYNEDGGQGYSGVPHDIWLKNTERVIIANNIFHFNGNPNRINIFFDATVFAQGLIVTGNIFGALAAEAVRLGVGAGNIHVGDNQFTGTIGITVNDLSSSAVITGQTAAGEYTVETQADSNASGPNFNLYRNSDSPEVGDVIASLKMRGNDSAGNVTNYVAARGVVSSPVDGNESAEWQFFALIAGALSRQLTVGNGVQIGAPLSGARGAGSLNVEGLVRATALELFSYDDGATSGPNAVSTRDSTTPAANDALGAEIYRGRNSAANLIDYALHRVAINNPTAGTETGEHQFFSRLAGALSRQLTISNGVQVGSPAGGSKGPGTLNIQGDVFVNNVAGATGTFASRDSKTVTVSNGIITGIA